MSITDHASLTELRQHLERLTPAEREKAALHAERANRADPAIPEHRVMLEQLRAIFHARGERPKRFTDPIRHFFISVEPFLIDDGSRPKVAGLIARSSLSPIWNVIRDFDRRAAGQYCDAVTDALLANPNVAQAMIHSFRRNAAEHGRRKLAMMGTDPDVERRLLAQVGSDRAMADLRDWVSIHANMERLQAFAGRLPAEIRSLPAEALGPLASIVAGPLMREAGLVPHALLLLMRRLSMAFHIVRLPRWAAGSDQLTAVRASAFGAALDLMLGHLHELQHAVTGMLKRGEYDEAEGVTKEFAENIRGLRAELNMASTHAFAHEVRVCCAAMSDLLRVHLDTLPGRLRRLLAPLTAAEIASGVGRDDRERREIVNLVDLFLTCRLHADELAINEVAQRLNRDVRAIVDADALRLVEALRTAPPAEAEARKAQLAIATGFVARLLGGEQAASLTRMAESAASPAFSLKRA